MITTRKDVIKVDGKCGPWQGFVLSKADMMAESDTTAP
jgi:hypothetical protein